MKKIIIGLGVGTVFVLYSMAMRHPDDVNVVIPSKSVASTTGKAKATNPNMQTPTGVSTATVSASTASTGQYKDGTYTGTVADAYYGNVQVAAKIRGGKLAEVTFLQYPNTHDTSVMINQQAMPYLRQEAIQAQNARVQIISGATFTSQAFIQSLTAALSQAKA